MPEPTRQRRSQPTGNGTEPEPVQVEVVEDWVENQRQRTLPPLPSQMLTFEAAFRPAAPIPFRLNCQVKPVEPGGPIVTEEHIFWAEGNPGAGGVLAMGGLIHYNVTGVANVDINAIKAFFARVLLEEDDGYDRFVALLERRDIVVEMEVLNSIINALMERYTGRP